MSTTASNTSEPTVNPVAPIAVVAPVVPITVVAPVVPATTTPPIAPITAAPPAVTAIPACITPMSSGSHTLGSFAHLPMLTKDNYQDWQAAIKAYLTGYRHVRVITRTCDATTSALVDPVCPMDATELEAWETSEGIAMGVIASTMYKLHGDLVTEHEGGSPLTLWKVIESQHLNKDISLCHQAWTLLFTHCQGPDDDYIDYWRRGADIKANLDRITPTNLTGRQVINEIYLFAQVYGLCTEDPLRHRYVSQALPSINEVYDSFLRLLTNKKTWAQVESVNAAFTVKCFHCVQPGHVAKDCPHAEALDKLVSQWNTNYSNRKAKWSKGRSQQGGGTPSSSNATSANAATTASPSANMNSNYNNNSNNSSAPTLPHESTGVATSFHSSQSLSADGWLVDSGATCTMTSNRNTFTSLRPDHQAIWLVDGRLIYSEGIGPIRFLSSCGYHILIENVLFVPSLTASLFASNRFAREHRRVYTESMEYPLRRWINHQSGATEFTATMNSNDLAYLDWKLVHSIESAKVSLAELHTRLNHLPRSEIKCLIHSRALAGLPDRVMNDSSDKFCEDCVNGKLTRAPHTRLAACVERLLVYSLIFMALCLCAAGVDTYIGSPSSMTTPVSLPYTLLWRKWTSSMRSGNTKRGRKISPAIESAYCVMIREESTLGRILTIFWLGLGSRESTPFGIHLSKLALRSGWIILSPKE